MTFSNLTPHSIRVADEDGNIVLDIAPSGDQARCSASCEAVGEFEVIPIVRSVFGPVEGLPEPAEDTIYIVSSLVAQQCAGREDVVAPDTGPTAVREGGQVVAVRRFQRF